MARLHLYHLFDLMMEDIKQHRYTPLIVSDCHGDPVEFSSLPLTMYADMQITEYPTISEVLEQYYARKNTVTRIRQKSADLRHITVTALERNRKKYALQMKQLKDTEKRDQYKVYGGADPRLRLWNQSGGKKL